MQDHWEIVKADDGWQMLRNGDPFYIQGAVAGGHIDELAAAGANSLRLRPRQETMDRAAERAGVPETILRQPRDTGYGG